MRGAIREDDGPGVSGPADDPYTLQPLYRFVNHFFDPTRNQGLTVSGIAGARAPDWAAGAVDAFGQANVKDTQRRNHFTIFDAQEAMFRASTLKTVDSVGNLVDLAGLPVDPTGRQSFRKAYWATTFRALGDVLHVNQDMAQPQHTRNEAHTGAYQIGLGHSSFIERYIDARVRREVSFDTGLWPFSAAKTVQIAPARASWPCDFAGQNCNDYPLPSPLSAKFKKYADFWSSSPTQVGGIGLADYSNSGFFSAGKNLEDAANDYALPPGNRTDPGYTASTASPTSWDGTPLAGPPMTFYQRDVPDHLNSGLTATAAKLTSYSMWDEFMEQHNGPPIFHLVRENYDDYERLLIPRAVAYSAGLLEYFFRGSLRIDLPPEGAYAVVDQRVQRCIDACGFKRVRLALTNTTPGEDLNSGRLLAVAKFHRNSCYQEDLSGEPGGAEFRGLSCRSPAEEIVVSEPIALSALNGGRLAAGATELLTFTFAEPIPINATDLYLQMVFRGALGAEQDAVVVTTKDISEPNYLAHTNVSDYSYDYAAHGYRALVSGETPVQDQGVSILLGSAQKPIASLSLMSAPGQAQLAYLTDVGTQLIRVQSVQSNYNPEWGVGVNTPVAEFAYNPGSGNYHRNVLVTPSRGVLRDSLVFTVLPYSGVHSIPSCTSEPELCIQATLPALTPDTILEWTINPLYVAN